MKIIGLTGGIGSGKSFVAYVAQKYFPVLHINTDEIARTQMKKGGISFRPVKDEFSKYGETLIGEDGEIDRSVLGRLVLEDEKLLLRLNEITHPNVCLEVERIIQEEKKKDIRAAVLIETALIYEAGIDKSCDEVWYVYAPLNTRIERLKTSRGYSNEKISGFLMRQNPEKEFLRRADRTIPNGDDVTEEDMKTIISAYLFDR